MPWNQVRYKRHPGCLAWPLTASGLGSLILGLYPDVCGRPHLPGGGARDLGAGSGDVAEKLFACTVAPGCAGNALSELLVTSLEPTKKMPTTSKPQGYATQSRSSCCGKSLGAGNDGMVLGPTSLCCLQKSSPCPWVCGLTLGL